MNVTRVCARHARARCSILLRHRRSASANHPAPSSPAELLHRAQRQPHGHQLLPIRCFGNVYKGENADDDDEEEWMPPDDSPLVKKGALSGTRHKASYADAPSLDSPDGIAMVPPEELDEDEIEVIDLEATLSDENNQRLLKNEQESSSSSSEFDVELSDVGWAELIRELRDAGETDMVERLVHEYNLHSYLEALDGDGGDGADLDDDDEDFSGAGRASQSSSTDADEEGWDEEFELSLQGLSEDELIDELIENSPSLSQLELEILSQEMERSDQGNDDLDHEMLEDMDLDDSAAYSEFRAMVLEDYREKKRARSTNRSASATNEETTTNFSTKADFEEYPPDWTDFDSKAAFKQDFLEDDDSWVPPSSGFIPSRSSRADESGEKGDQAKSSPKDAELPPANDLDNTIDWLQARRSRLGVDESSAPRPTHLMTPGQAEQFRHQNSRIPVKLYTLFTPAELSTSLSAQGGSDIHIIDTSKFEEKHGIGCKFIMLVTGRNPSHIRVLADSVVRNLKARKLAERGVVGAMQGAEGGQDIFSNKRSRNRAKRNGALNVTGKLDDDWIVVDCENIHVHILEESSRQCLNIEGLWDLDNPHSEGSKLRRIDINDEDSVDDYVASNPIPDEYAAKIFGEGGGRKTDRWITAGTGGRVSTVPGTLHGKSFSEKWRDKGRSKRARRRSNR